MGKGSRILPTAVLCALAAAGSSPAAAQLSDQWQFGANLYGWFPSIKGTSTFPEDTGSSINVDADTVLSNLKFVFMGTFEARKGRWGAFTDLVYIDVGDQKSGTRDFTFGGGSLPAGAEGNLDYDLKGTIWALAGEYRWLADPGVTSDVFAGARMVDIDQTLRYELTGSVGSIPVGSRSGTRELNARNWDGIVGVKGRLNFGADRAWFIPYYADVGAGDSDLTWQAMTGLGYAFKWGEIVLQYRYLDYDFGERIDSLSLGGPAVSFNFRW